MVDNVWNVIYSKNCIRRFRIVNLCVMMYIPEYVNSVIVPIVTNNSILYCVGNNTSLFKVCLLRCIFVRQSLLGKCLFSIGSIIRYLRQTNCRHTDGNFKKFCIRHSARISEWYVFALRIEKSINSETFPELKFCEFIRYFNQTKKHVYIIYQFSCTMGKKLIIIYGIIPLEMY